MQSEYPYHPLKHMEPLRIQSASGIHLPMQSEYPYHPFKHMEPLRFQSTSGNHLPMQSVYPYQTPWERLTQKDKQCYQSSSGSRRLK